MNHQQFETWLFSDEILSQEERASLQEHLQSCESCRELSAAWKDVEDTLVATPAVMPPLGFTQRWQNRLAKDRLRRESRQTRAILILGVSGIALSLVLIGYFSFHILQAPVPFALLLAYQVTTLVYTVQNALGISGLILKTMFTVIPPTMWIALSIALGSLGVLWMVTIQKLTSKRRIML